MPTFLELLKKKTPAMARGYDEARGKDRQFYGCTRWRKLRQVFRSLNPLCADCLRNGKTVVGREVHHLKDRKDHPDLAFEMSNLEHLCKSCHSRETRRRASGKVIE